MCTLCEVFSFAEPHGFFLYCFHSRIPGAMSPFQQSRVASGRHRGFAEEADVEVEVEVDSVSVEAAQLLAGY